MKKVFRLFLIAQFIGFCSGFSGLVPAGLLFGAGQKYKGRVFDIADLNKDGKKQVLCRLDNTVGIGIFKEGDILLLNPILTGATTDLVINDLRIGDVDNDGEDEIVAIGKDDLYIWGRQNDQFLLDSSKTTPIYGDKRIGDSEILNAAKIITNKRRLKDQEEEAKRIAFLTKRKPRKGEIIKPPLSEQEQSKVEKFYEEIYERSLASEWGGKRIAIGDFTNDGKNEIIITKLSRYIGSAHGDRTGYCFTLDVLKWRDKHFEVILSEPITSGLGEEGIAVFDLNEDGKHELIVAQGWDGYGIFQYDPQYTSPRGEGDDYYLIKGFKRVFGGRLSKSAMEAKLAAGMIGKSPCLVACVVSTYRRWSQEDIGKLKLFHMGDLSRWNWREAGWEGPPSELPWELPVDQLGKTLIASINLPTEIFEEYRENRIAKIESIVLGDIDNDGKSEIITNYKDGFYIIGMTAEGALAFK